MVNSRDLSEKFSFLKQLFKSGHKIDDPLVIENPKSLMYIIFNSRNVLNMIKSCSLADQIELFSFLEKLFNFNRDNSLCLCDNNIFQNITEYYWSICGKCASDQGMVLLRK